jgi:hypothetical protein
MNIINKIKKAKRKKRKINNLNKSLRNHFTSKKYGYMKPYDEYKDQEDFNKNAPIIDDPGGTCPCCGSECLSGIDLSGIYFLDGIDLHDATDAFVCEICGYAAKYKIGIKS